MDMRKIANPLIVVLIIISLLFPKLSFAQVNTLPITGTWVNLAYKDVRNKYTNPKDFDNTDPLLWETKVKELDALGIKYLVLMEVANEGKAYYPSRMMPWLFDKNLKSPVEAILDEAAKHGMKVFMSTGWAKDQDDNLLDPAIKNRQLEIMEELSVLYKDKKAFYGWYLPVEDCLGPVLAQHAVESVNALVAKAHELTPGKKTMISPYGIGLADFDHPDFERRLAGLTVDIIAYQDEVGCVRDQFTIPRLKENWKKMRAIHDKMNIEMWANCETFTWEEGTNDRQSALIPSAYSRVLAQQVAASEGGVDCIISFMFGGIIEDPDSPFQLGQAHWSCDLWRSYKAWTKSEAFWKYMESSFAGTLKNGVPDGSEIKGASKKLIDSKVAEITEYDDAWEDFSCGVHDIVIDFGKELKVNDVMVRMLNYHKDSIEPAQKAYVYFSNDGKTWNLKSIQNTGNFPNTKHDAWIDAAFFKQLKAKARYMKISFSSPSRTFIDEIYVNPVLLK